MWNGLNILHSERINKVNSLHVHYVECGHYIISLFSRSFKYAITEKRKNQKWCELIHFSITTKRKPNRNMVLKQSWAMAVLCTFTYITWVYILLLSGNLIVAVKQLSAFCNLLTNNFVTLSINCTKVYKCQFSIFLLLLLFLVCLF